MPGTIHVTVLEFKGASSSSNPSAKSLKVSMGKKYYQTWDKGDFSFPVTKLKEDLIVKLLDAGENEIAHADVRTIQVIEKGYWDEVFSLEGGGGGHVHMKLQFVLSDEERKRIRVMRESAMKKKQETNPTINLRLSDSSDAVQTSTRDDRKIPDVVRPKVETSQADVSLNSPTSSGDSPFRFPEQERKVLGNEIPIIAVEGVSSSPVLHEIQSEPAQVHQSVPFEKIEPVIISDKKSIPFEKKIETHSPVIISDKKNLVPEKLGDDPINKSQNRGPQKLLSNVRKMISAFETSEIQEAKSAPKAPKIVVQPADRSFKKHKDDTTRADTELPRAAMELEPNSSPSPSRVKPSNVENIIRKEPRELIVKEIGKSPSDVFRQSRETSNIDQDISGEAPKEPIVKELEKPVSDVTRQSTSETVVNSEIIHEEQSREASYVKDISIEASSEPIVEEMEKPGVDETGQSTLETAINLERIHDEQSREASYVEDISIEALSEPIVKEMDKPVVYEMGQSTLETSTSLGSNKHEERSRKRDLKVGPTSNEKPKSLECYEEEYCSSEGIWIFPDNTRRLCITTAGDPSLEAKHHEQTKISPKPEMLEKKNTAIPKESGSGSSPDVSLNGLVGQVIKVVAILGFGVLVFLTRQKEPRKKNREENVRLFTIPSYIDGTTLIE